MRSFKTSNPTKNHKGVEDGAWGGQGGKIIKAQLVPSGQSRAFGSSVHPMSVQTKFNSIYSRYFDGLQDPIRHLLNKKSLGDVLIIAHGDMDGIACSVAMKTMLDSKMNRCECVYTLPHLIVEHQNTEVYDLIIVLDVAINNRHPQMSLNFIEHNKTKLLWIDHHFIDISLVEHLPCNVIIKKRDSCVILFRELFPVKFSKKVENLLDVAHQTDLGNGDNIFNHALKINLQAEETRREIYEYGTSIEGGELERFNLTRIKRKAGEYAELEANLEFVLKNLTKVYKKEKLAIIDMRETRDKTIDHTSLFFRLYGKGYDVVIRKYYEKQKRHTKKKPAEYLNIARSPSCKINLVKCFGLRSGAPFRITVKNKWTDKEIIKKIINYKS